MTSIVNSPTMSQDPWSSVTIDEIDATIRNQTTWVCIAIVADLSQEADHIGSWSEGCPCHSKNPAQRNLYEKQVASAKRKKRRIGERGFQSQESCPYHGCRSYELASGEGLASLKNKMMSNRLKVILHSSDIPKKETFISDWDHARARLWSSSVAIFGEPGAETGKLVEESRAVRAVLRSK